MSTSITTESTTPTPITPKDIEGQLALWQCVQNKLRAAHRSGGRVTDAEAEAVWQCPEVQEHLKKSGLLGEAVVRRLYDHLVARGNTHGGRMQQPSFPQAAAAFATHDMSAQVAGQGDYRRAVADDGRIDDQERHQMNAAYQQRLAALGVPFEMRKKLAAFYNEQLDYTNAANSYRASEVCQYGPAPLKELIALAGKQIARAE